MMTGAQTSVKHPIGVPVKKKGRRVLVVDDHPIVRQGLRRLIDQEEDLVVCGEVETVKDARTAIRELHPDVVIVDISLKQGDGIDLVTDARAQHPRLPILVLSMHDETIYAERVLSSGANGYIMDYLKASGAGTVDFVSKAVNYRLQTTLYQVPEQGAGAEMKDLKAAEIPVRVSGTIDDPKVGLDTEALAKAQAGQKLEETKQEMTEKLKEKLGKWLGGKKP